MTAPSRRVRTLISGIGSALLLTVVLAPVRAPMRTTTGPALSTTVLDSTLEVARGRVDPASEFESARAAFDVRVDGETAHFALRSVLLLPGTTLTIEAPSGATLVHAAGVARARGTGLWVWEAPADPGVHALRVESTEGDAVDLVAFVLHPRSRVRSGFN